METPLKDALTSDLPSKQSDKGGWGGLCDDIIHQQED